MIFYANSLNQIKPDIIMSGLTLHSRHARIQMGEGVRGFGGPLLKYQLVRIQIFMYVQYWHSSDTSFKWLFAGGPIMVRLYHRPAYSGIWILSPLIKLIKNV